jgi:hypothetical protein
MNTFGEITWEEDIFGGDKRANNKDIWLRLDDGSNEMRLVTQPFQYLSHRYKKEGDKGFGQKVYCSSVHGSCPLCALGDKAKPRWLIGVISRKTGTFKILDISYAVFSQIRKLARNTQRWGDPTKYDIDIYVDRNGGALGYYSVQPLPKEPLSAADQILKDNVDIEVLKQKVSPPTAEQVQKRLDKINEVDPATQQAASTNVAPVTAVSKKGKKATPPPVSLDNDDEDSESFPDYDATSAN